MSRRSVLGWLAGLVAAPSAVVGERPEAIVPLVRGGSMGVSMLRGVAGPEALLPLHAASDRLAPAMQTLRLEREAPPDLLAILQRIDAALAQPNTGADHDGTRCLTPSEFRAFMLRCGTDDATAQYGRAYADSLSETQADIRAIRDGRE